MELIFASGSRHKLKELEKILKPHSLRLPVDLRVPFSFEEGDASFLDNALGKAKALYASVKSPVIADDSGICVPSLGFMPGVVSARYGSAAGEEPLSDRDKIGLLLHNLEPFEDRSAFFVCSMALVLDSNRFYIVQETVHGSIAFKPAGSGGFGYDPVFLVEDTGRTMAELTETEKNLVSHRARAGIVMKRLLDQPIK